MSQPRHDCREGDEVGVDMAQRYPRLITFCAICKARVREIPLDDVPEKFQGVVHDIIAYIKQRGRRGS